MKADEHYRVLVIEDNDDGADTLADLLRSLGHEVVIARDGETGLEMEARWNPDAVLLDLQLPSMDGYEVARSIRARRREGVRIIALTGFGRAEDRERSERAGCDGHLVKPAALAQIIRALAGQG